MATRFPWVTFTADVVLNQPRRFGQSLLSDQRRRTIHGLEHHRQYTSDRNGGNRLCLPHPRSTADVHCDIIELRRADAACFRFGPPIQVGSTFRSTSLLISIWVTKPPIPMLAIDFGVRLQFDYNFASQELVMNVDHRSGR